MSFYILYVLARRQAAPAAPQEARLPPHPRHQPDQAAREDADSPQLGCQSPRSASPQPPPRRQVQPAYTKEEYLKVYNDVSSSVVTVVIKLNIGVPKTRGVVHTREATGLIVGLGKKDFDTFRTIVAVHDYCFHGSETPPRVEEVEFSDGTICRHPMLLPMEENSEFRLVEVLELTNHENHKRAEFSVEGVTMNEQQIFSIISLKRRLCMFKSPIIQANCEAVARQDWTHSVEGSQDYFAFRCPIAAVLSLRNDYDRQRRDMVFKRIVGAPIFNMMGKVVGIVSYCGQSYDLKFGRQGRYVNDELTPPLICCHFLKKGQSLLEPTPAKQARKRKRRNM